MPAAEWQNARRILCVRLDTMGDVLMTTPAIRALKESGAAREITLLTSPSGAEIASMVPEIDRVIVYDAPWMKATAPRADSRPEFEMIEQLRGEGFDAVSIFTVYSQNPLPSAMMCYLADIPLRLAHSHENPYQLLTDWVKDPEPEQMIRHEAQRQIDLVGAVGAVTRDPRLSVRVQAGASERVAGVLRAKGIETGAPWMVVHPGATAEARRYPPEFFAAAIQALAEKYDYQVVLTGTGSEQALVEEIQRLACVPTVSLAGELPLGEMVALIAATPILLSNNSGPVHIAAATGTLVVDLYALTNPQHTPWAVPHRVLYHDVPCRFCYRSVCPEGHHQCLRGIPPDAVASAVAELAAETAGRSEQSFSYRGTPPLANRIPTPSGLTGLITDQGASSQGVDERR